MSIHDEEVSVHSAIKPCARRPTKGSAVYVVITITEENFEEVRGQWRALSHNGQKRFISSWEFDTLQWT